MLDQDISIRSDIELARSANTSSYQPDPDTPSFNSPLSYLVFSASRVFLQSPWYHCHVLWQIHSRPNKSFVTKESKLIEYPTIQNNETSPDLNEDIKMQDIEESEVSSDPMLPATLPLNTSLFRTWTLLYNLPHQGISSLWSGFSFGVAYETTSLFLEPVIDQTIQDIFPLRYDTIPNDTFGSLGPAVFRSILSQVLCTYLISPFDILRTRMICQTGPNSKRKYKGFFSSLSILFEKEGSYGVYYGTNGLATLCYSITSSCMRHLRNLFMDLFIESVFPNHAFMLLGAECAWDLIELGILLPLETVRRRLQMQDLDNDYLSIVPFKKYSGYLECFQRVFNEEGVVGLYSGFQTRFLTLVCQQMAYSIIRNLDED